MYETGASTESQILTANEILPSVTPLGFSDDSDFDEDDSTDSDDEENEGSKKSESLYLRVSRRKSIRHGSSGVTVSQNEWTLTIAAQAITQNADVAVTQGTSVGKLKTALQNEWTLAITSQTITESALFLFFGIQHYTKLTSTTHTTVYTKYNIQ